MSAHKVWIMRLLCDCDSRRHMSARMKQKGDGRGRHNRRLEYPHTRVQYTKGKNMIFEMARSTS